MNAHSGDRVTPAPVVRKPSILEGSKRTFALLLMGHLLVFAFSTAHDEIVWMLVEAGYVQESAAERVELLMMLAVFVAWTVLMLRFVAFVRAVQRAGPDWDKDE